jgi:hypothetical protein
VLQIKIALTQLLYMLVDMVMVEQDKMLVGAQ